MTNPGDNPHDPSGPPLPPPPGDPRLRIPEVLRQPVRKPEALKDYERLENARSRPGASDSARQATGWAIAMSFVWTVAAGGVLGWAAQWAWPKAAPWPLVIGLIVGILVGMAKFIKDAIKANNQP